MKEYNEGDLLRLAKRFKNNKRSYLFVNPLQGKHLGASPTSVLELFHTLGEKVKEVCGGAGLVIGFAETATAIGMGVAETIGDDCLYIHTTREDVHDSDIIEFSEEHSHAVNHKLVISNIENVIEKTKCIVFVDDEISTGKTMCNFVERLRNRFDIKDKRLVVASLINRVSEENENILKDYGIECVYLLKLDDKDYEGSVKKYDVREAIEPFSTMGAIACVTPNERLLNPRFGLRAGDYKSNCKKFAESTGCISGEDILVLGTEECMYPAIVLGAYLEGRGKSVFTHSTTRSPIGILDSDDYPIRSGYKIGSLYEGDRVTYIYNLRNYDQVIIVTDSGSIPEESLDSIRQALAQSGNEKIILVKG